VKRSGTLVLLLCCFTVLCSIILGGASPAEKKRAWGESVTGLALSAWTSREQYRKGEKIEFSYKLKNFGKEKIQLRHTRPATRAMRIALFHSDGRPVARKGKPMEFGYPRPIEHLASVSTISLEPGKEEDYERVPTNLSELFELGNAGSYYMILMFRLSGGQDFLLVSNLVAFRVAEP
jgi:hypothetical protein